MSIKGIETEYRGILFRSRAEARWAAFFDLLGWPWQYEPIDLEGYIPDFVVGFREPLLVEVKGGVLPQDVPTSETIRMACSKIECSSWGHRAIVVGSAPRLTDPQSMLIGWFVAPDADNDETANSEACLFRCGACGDPSIHSGSGSWQCIRCGAYDGDRYVEAVEDAPELWAKACNATQWRAA